MASSPENRVWLRSEEVRRLLRISTCQLAHLRQEGKLEYTKVGNAYLYLAPDEKCIGRYDKNHARSGPLKSGRCP